MATHSASTLPSDPSLTSTSDTPSTAPTSAHTPDDDGTGDPDQDTPQTEKGSWTPVHGKPPPVKDPYDPREALDDIPGVSHALELFLASHMVESEDYCHTSDPDKERMYFATGYGLIQCVKGLMSYADEDLLSGINHTKHGNHIAGAHRKKAQFLGSRLAGYVLGSSGAGFVKGMTDVERHAELVYAESLFEKALLGIVYSGDWLAFIKEALNMRTTISIYRQLGSFLDDADAAYAASLPADSVPPTHAPSLDATSPQVPRAEDPAIDAHFRSGVYLGVGMCNIVLSLMPGKLAALVELFGYKGDRARGLATLMRAGGWDQGGPSDGPAIGAAAEGVRRSICDMALLIFHLVLSSFTVDGVDVALAQRILDWNLKRYPNGVFFLFGAGRLALVRSQPARAIAFYARAAASQAQYRNLHHISFWETALAHLALGDAAESLRCWRTLEREATWSKSIYSYGAAVCLLESAVTDEERQEAARLMARVPGLRQKIAGKSIPLEKFVARKARKFAAQGGRLALPALEAAYVFQAVAHAPRAVVAGRMLPAVRGLLAALAAGPGAYAGGAGAYWDDVCLARFLEGVCLRYVAYPDPDAVLDPGEEVPMPREEAVSGAVAAFKAVFEHGPKIELDHHLVYHAHYELGRLLACGGDTEGARREFELVVSGKYLEVGPSGRKGRYSMENALHMRTHAALEALHQGRL